MGSMVVSVAPRVATIGPSVFYGKFHQFGGTRAGWPNGCPPKRAFLGVNDENLKELHDIVEDYISSKFA
jgi:phage gpG-like protein